MKSKRKVFFDIPVPIGVFCADCGVEIVTCYCAVLRAAEDASEEARAAMRCPDCHKAAARSSVRVGYAVEGS